MRGPPVLSFPVPVTDKSGETHRPGTRCFVSLRGRPSPHPGTRRGGGGNCPPEGVVHGPTPHVTSGTWDLLERFRNPPTTPSFSPPPREVRFPTRTRFSSGVPRRPRIGPPNSLQEVSYGLKTLVDPLCLPWVRGDKSFPRVS